MNVKSPIYSVIYEGKNITEDLQNDLVSLTYNDKAAGATDDISIVLDDSKGLWKNQWTPAKGDRLNISIGYDDFLVPCGVFEVDEIDLYGPPDQVSIKATAISIKSSYRQKSSVGHESKTIKEIAQSIAEKHGLELSGIFNDDIKINRVTQFQETDLSFLRKLSEQFGYVFNIRNDKIIFTSIYDLEDSDSIIELRKSDFSRYRITDKSTEDYKEAEVRYINPDDNQLVVGSAKWESQTKNDKLVIWKKAESLKHAEAIAKSVLHNKNTRRQTGSFGLAGNPSLLAGVNIDIGGLGRVSGQYHILNSSHTISGGGYVCSFNAKKIAEINSNKWL